ncbi:MAG: bifunctional phosphoribosylaminoimidazolecarboxamide formyltransferase/IMP cyclohydrolase [Deltaproteobacteria bacterium]|nr:bifunctional phosphoribosylaminoimidazolecarboxamide formyltransferase/IMP cyclohydrolase [Deltaproteobacteria bacterium]
MPVIKRALISVSNKNGLVPFAQKLASLRIEILSTGGTAKFLKENKIPVVEVGDYTGQPEILDGRLKTLHPRIHGGILAIRSNAKHLEELKKSNIGLIDLVVVNLYPFEETVAKPNVSLEEAVEQIDIGGPTMIRAAAKNWQDVTVVVDPEDYPSLIGELPGVSSETNFRLAKKVFALMSRYDGAITNYLTGGKDNLFPEAFNYHVRKVQDLRYGENPHQKGAFYRDQNPVPSVATAKQLHGKELSFNNILDLDAALGMVREFQEPAVAVIKHNNPCGVAVGGEGELKEIFVRARDCDPLSAFGGVIGINRVVDKPLAQEIAKDFYEAVITPGFEPEALEILKRKKNIRLLEENGDRGGFFNGLDFKKVVGGLLVQESDLSQEDIRKAKVVTRRGPTEEEWQALSFAWKVVKHVKSNAIVFVEGKRLCTVGIGAGQMSRIDSTKIAIIKTKSSLKGTALASDAFFPFKDNVEEVAKVGVTAIIQPGGSIKDQESIEAADKAGIAMVFTGIRHFRH